MRDFLCITRILWLAALGEIALAAPVRGEQSARAEPLLEWTPVIAEAIQSSTAAPCLASRNLAIIYAAAFDAINAAAPIYEAYALERQPPQNLDAATAGIAAAAYAAETYFPSRKSAFAQLRDRQFLELQQATGESTFAESVAFGQGVARDLIERRADDGSTSSQTYYPRNELGKWKRTPPRYRPPELSNWSSTRPFLLKSGSQFRLPPPPRLGSEEYAAAMEEVRRLGGIDSSEREPEQAEIARFWSCFSYTSTPAGHWYEIATALARREQLSLVEAARLLALANLSMADAGIACWDTKYSYEFWRPIHAIRAAEADGNPATHGEPEWFPLLETPPHPEYASGHGAFSGAGGKVMELFFDAADGYAFTTTSSSLPGVVRSYESFAQCTEEILMSRLYGGIHFRFSNEGGRMLGEQIAEYTFENYLRPLARVGAR